MFHQTIGAQPFNEWEQHSRESDDNYGNNVNNTLVSIDGNYECDHNSYFQSIRKTYEYTQQVWCNELFVSQPDKPTYTLGLRNGKQVDINQIDTYMALKDQDGKEVFWRIGRVRGGHCDGDLLFIESFNIPTKGSCDSHTGVTYMRSTKTLYTLRGKCQSTCFGSATVHYEPGKRNLYSNKHHYNN